MRVLKNLFGKSDKIHVDEIAVAPNRLLGDSVIVDSGSNSNGSWVKWADGTMVCYGYFESPLIANQASGAIYISNPETRNFPQPFASTPVVTLSSVSSWRWVDLNLTPTTTSFSYHIMRAISSTSTGNVFYLAFGRWK